MPLVILVISVLFFFLVIAPFIIYFDWVTNTKAHQYHTKLNKDTIKKLYQVAPRRWKLKRGDELYIVYKTDDYKEIHVYTSFFDALWLMYNSISYTHNERKNRQQQDNDDALLLILKQNNKDFIKLKEDIDSLIPKKAIKELKERTNNLERIVTR